METTNAPRLDRSKVAVLLMLAAWALNGCGGSEEDEAVAAEWFESQQYDIDDRIEDVRTGVRTGFDSDSIKMRYVKMDEAEVVAEDRDCWVQTWVRPSRNVIPDGDREWMLAQQHHTDCPEFPDTPDSGDEE